MFLAKDVAEWLEMDISNASRIVKNIDEDEYIIARHNMTTATFLTEDGIYEVLMQSRKPIAKQWKREVKKILKRIRLTGGTVQTDREEEFIHNYFPSFSDEIKKAMVLDLHATNKELQFISNL
ncbi:BRO-N domain-containing protein [Bacillus wiedmannii]|uniref:BRO-N domain-containing protein n=1 Tax=Bacillus wiedmannii TaxID=1890302 RepID=UPI0026D9993E